MLRRLAAAIGALLVAVAAESAVAETICGERAELVIRLEKGYGEVASSLGLASDGTLFEVFASTEGTWSLLVTRPNGRSCLVAHGEAWENLPPPANGLGVQS